ncbi:glycosyltransferase family 2 protein [Flavobacterium sp. D11R37]|uniref:glycosyltransferase family 2 protein n=1 Tax=Flavobacterium coralii TaxID=2838017 RepID=UPI001CA7A6ED|nr:glycosyltransferase family 2 protein [Flavobacterium coralii]MBY8963899.1 glycosyltransferase family 2 protein [Flavobacterium coralii]
MAGEYTKEDIEILIATMDRQDDGFLKSMFPFTDYHEYKLLIVNQTTEENKLHIQHNNIRVFNVFEKGLSKSRNLALKNANGKICIFTDDDVIFKKSFTESVAKAFNEFPDAGLISFMTEDEKGQPFKKYADSTKRIVSTKDCLNIMSIEMVVNLQNVKNTGCRFDERFGLGAQFGMGEEAIYLSCLLQNNLELYSYPETIVIHPKLSTHTSISVKDKYYIQGAFFSKLLGSNYMYWLLLKIMYEFKQHRIRLNQIIPAITAAKKGRADFLKYE